MEEEALSADENLTEPRLSQAHTVSRVTFGDPLQFQARQSGGKYRVVRCLLCQTGLLTSVKASSSVVESERRGQKATEPLRFQGRAQTQLSGASFESLSQALNRALAGLAAGTMKAWHEAHWRSCVERSTSVVLASKACEVSLVVSTDENTWLGNPQVSRDINEKPGTRKQVGVASSLSIQVPQDISAGPDEQFLRNIQDVCREFVSASQTQISGG